MKQFLYLFVIFLMIVAVIATVGIVTWAFSLLNGEIAFFVGLLFVFALIMMFIIYGSKNRWFEC